MKTHRFQILGSNPERVRVVPPAKKSDKLADIAARLKLPTHPLEEVETKFKEWGAVRIKHPTQRLYKLDDERPSL
jgi:hypothetical protein